MNDIRDLIADGLQNAENERKEIKSRLVKIVQEVVDEKIIADQVNLTPEQCEQWRKILFASVGIYSNFLSDAQIQTIVSKIATIEARNAFASKMKGW